MGDIHKKVLDWIRQEALIKPGERILVALSGGADSVLLLRLLLELQEPLGISLAGGHYNHQLRGKAADDDARFAKDLCKQFDVPFLEGTGNVAQAAKDSGCSIEEAGRNMRYAWLTDAAKALGADKIATGHHGEDNIETILLNLVRGAGIAGLGGIPPRRDNIIRPILCLDRQEIEAYLAHLGQEYREDETNGDMVYRRNALRHGVLPLLKEQNPNLAQSLLRQSALLRQDAHYLDQIAQAHSQNWGNKLPVEELLALDKALLGRVLKKACPEANYSHIIQMEQLLKNDKPSAQIDLPGAYVARREYGKLVITQEKASVTAFTPITLPSFGRVELPQLGVNIVITEEKKKKHNNYPSFLFQRDKICGKITLSMRKIGDKIQLAGKPGARPIKKLMIDEKIPAHMRDRLLVISDEMGPIAVESLGVAQRVLPENGGEIMVVILEKREEHA